ncbi:MAG: ATP-binding cassette domain-containing protein, partial [Acidimicrobiales bacterium]
TRAPMHARCRNGLGYLTEERSVILGMAVADNLKLAGVPRSVAIAHFPALEAIMDRSAGLCSGGEQQMLSLARALGREPQVLLADELSLGLAPIIVTNLLKAVRDAAKERGVAVLLVEQHVRQALAIADRAYVMERGRIVLSGTADEVLGQIGRLEAAYLADG